MLLPVLDILDGFILVKVIPGAPDIESEKSKVVNVLVANPFKNSVKTSSLNVKLTSELSVVIEEVDIIALELSRVKVILSVPRFELNGKPEVDTVAVTKFTDEETVQK